MEQGRADGQIVLERLAQEGVATVTWGEARMVFREFALLGVTSERLHGALEMDCNNAYCSYRF